MTSGSEWPHPERLALSIGGFFGSSFSVEWVDGALSYTRWEHHRDNHPRLFERLDPSVDAWVRFWDDLRAAGLPLWAPAYLTEGVIDGGGWTFDVAGGGLDVRTTGSNSYPDDHFADGGIEAGDSEPFRLALEAVTRLVDGRPFG